MSHEIARSHHVAEDLAGEKLSQALRSLPARIPPAGLTTNLRVIASRQRQRFLERRTWGQTISTWYANISLNAGDAFKSMALPVTGGVFTAVVLFSTWLVPTYPLHAQGANDVPTILTTEATVQQAVLGFPGGNAVLDVTVDDQGNMIDYAIVSGGDQLQDPARRSRLTNVLLFTHFTPATEFGRPMASKTLLYLQPGIDVQD